MKKIICLLLLTAVPAFAHATLVSSQPIAKAKVKSPQQIRLTFSETLEPAFSGAALTDAGGRNLPVPAAVGGTAITLLPMALKPGGYTVSWHSVGRDTHRMSGSFGFTVIP